jgi:hypothetical protein
MTKWTKVEDGLPPQDIDVLAYCKSLGRNSMFTNGEKYFAVDQLLVINKFRTDSFFDAKVTHWMPLPEPPHD